MESIQFTFADNAYDLGENVVADADEPADAIAVVGDGAIPEPGDGSGLPRPPKILLLPLSAVVAAPPSS